MSRMIPLLYIDAVAGASGDMFLGALVDLGADFDAMQEMLSQLRVPGFRLERRQVFKHTIAGTKVDVIVEDDPHAHRHLADLLAIVDRSGLPERVRTRATKILTRLATAESQVHRMPLENVHLHEVGGLDALVDVVGTCIGLELLEVTRVYSGPVSVGTGVIACAHGKMPEPAPGTLALLRGFPIRKTAINGELTTPTGAAIITGLATGFIDPLVLVPRRIGYGAGTVERREIANLLRLMLAETEAKLIPNHYHAPKDEEPHAHGGPPEHDHPHDHAHDHTHDHDHDHAHGHSHTY